MHPIIYLKQQLGLINQLTMLKLLLWRLKSGVEIRMTKRWMDRSFYKPFGVYYLCRGAWCKTNIYVHVVSVEYYSL